MKRYAKALSMLLAIIMVVGLLPLSIIAEDINTPVRYTVLLLDTEKSFTISIDNVVIYEVETPIEIIKEAAKKFVNQIQVAGGKNYVAVVSYSSSAKTETGFTADAEALTSSIDKIGIGGQFANINAALEQADTLLSGVTTEGAEKNIVLFTQGVNGEGKYSSTGHYSKDDCGFIRNDNKVGVYEYSNVTYETAQDLHEKYSIYTIGFFEKFSEVPENGMPLLNFAKRFSSDLQNKSFYDVDDEDDLPFVFEDVAGDIINPLNVALNYTYVNVVELNGSESYIEITVNATVTNKSNADSVDTKIRIDELNGLNFISDSTQNEYVIGTLASMTAKKVTWKLKADIPEGEKKYQIKVVAGSNNSVAIEKYLTITIDGNARANDFPESDRWSFKHGAVANYKIDDDSLNWLISYYRDNTTRDNLRRIFDSEISSKWGGSCAGMAVSALLFKLNRLSPAYWNKTSETKTSISDLSVDEARSLINYYYLMQYAPEQQNHTEQILNMSMVDRIALLEDLVSDSAVALGFNWSYKYEVDCMETKADGTKNEHKKGDIDPYGHMVIAYGVPENSASGWMVDGEVYHNRIHIYDVNYKDDSVYLFYEPYKVLAFSFVNWTIAIENSRSASRPYSTIYFTEKDCRKMTGKKIGFITNDMDILDYRNIEERNIGSSEAKNNQCRLVAENLTKKLRVMKATGEYSDIAGLVSTGDITFDTYYNNLYLPDSDYTPPLNILTDSESYKVVNISDAESLDLTMEYENVYEYAQVDNCDEITFDPVGSIKFIGDNSSYSLSMVFNDGYHTTPWYKTTVEGDSANEITMEQTSEGIIVTGDNLTDIKIIVTDDNGDKELVVSTDKDSMLITNNGEEPVIKIDSDNDGVYDKDITPKKENSSNTPSNSIIFPNLYNVTVTVGEGGKTNTSDTFYIAYGASRTIKITPDDGYEVADVLVNGKSVGAVDSYSIKGACMNYDIEVSFEKIPD